MAVTLACCSSLSVIVVAAGLLTRGIVLFCGCCAINAYLREQTENTVKLIERLIAVATGLQHFSRRSGVGCRAGAGGGVSMVVAGMRDGSGRRDEGAGACPGPQERSSACRFVARAGSGVVEYRFGTVLAVNLSVVMRKSSRALPVELLLLMVALCG